MKLYHFTAKFLLDSILKEGLTKGGMPIITDLGIRFARPLQWLTSNEEFEQIWCDRKVLLQYDRNEVRLTIRIPKHDKKNNLVKWDEFIERHKEFEQTAKYLNDSTGDYKNWYLFAGSIKPKWIEAIDYKPLIQLVN